MNLCHENTAILASAIHRKFHYVNSMSRKTFKVTLCSTLPGQPVWERSKQKEINVYISTSTDDLGYSYAIPVLELASTSVSQNSYFVHSLPYSLGIM